MKTSVHFIGTFSGVDLELKQTEGFTKVLLEADPNNPVDISIFGEDSTIGGVATSAYKLTANSSRQFGSDKGEFIINYLKISIPVGNYVSIEGIKISSL